MTKKMMIIEEHKPLSQSQLWAAQRNFYHQKGANAWAHEVPYYITSNPVIASRYAELVIRFIQDWISQHPDSSAHPFYILELAAGNGQFSYFVLQKLLDMKDKLQRSDIDIRYIMSDFTEKNINFWKKHEQLKTYVDQGILQFAKYDVEKDEAIDLQHQIEPIGENPLIVFANYIFDTLKNDVFSIKDHSIQASNVTLFDKRQARPKPYRLDLSQIKMSFHDVPMEHDYYEDPQFNALLQYYCHNLDDTKLLFPIGSLRGLKNLIRFSHNRCLLISSDKGWTGLKELEGFHYPKIDVHGSISWMVNYHAITQYLNHFDTNHRIQTAREGITTIAYGIGLKFADLPETQLALNNIIDGFSPADYFTCSEHMIKTTKRASLDSLLSLLRLSDWDPFVFGQIHAALMQQLPTAHEEVVEYMLYAADSIAQHFYATPGCEDIFFLIGLVLYQIDKFEASISYYLLSEKYFAANFETRYNIGLCYFYQENYKKAAQFFKKALRKDPNSKSTQAMLRRTEKKMQSR